MPDQVQHQPVIAAIGSIHQNSGRGVEGGNHNVESPVVIQVSKCRASLITLAQEILAHLGGDVNKGLPVDILEHGVVLGR